jgi:hypothetical protein
MGELPAHVVLGKACSHPVRSQIANENRKELNKKRMRGRGVPKTPSGAVNRAAGGTNAIF